MNRLEIYKNDNYVLNDAFDQAVMNIYILKRQNGYKSFLMCGCEAGDGTTTVAINLAAALASSGCKTVLIDGDMRKKNSYKRLNESVTFGLSDYLLNRTSIDNIIYETTTENLYYIPCGELIDNPTRLLCSSKMDEVRNKLSMDYDFIIYDMPAVNAATDAKVVAVSVDAVVLVSSMGKTSKKGVVDAANALVEIKANLVGTIINKLDMKQYASYNENYDYFRNEKYVDKKRISKRKNSD
ncbi:CpsD/CapB family tyrosine-protein kinase [Butyrivibrio sp. WCD3002]|uniref:CpsD/CapB family tyrosine-protein kinase n=1 Tax=Butyrivibrio sp. WCD3002 TaxID=1280676 RepID=UPI00040E2791|nr:CpsD/CapB family tyrosine-protein kinase [Butyrivibrio sp. WCD3002]